MSIIAWITAAFGALVVGVAINSVLDELLNDTAQPQSGPWPQEAILRSVVSAVLTMAAMALWTWFWMRYVVGIDSGSILRLNQFKAFVRSDSGSGVFLIMIFNAGVAEGCNIVSCSVGGAIVNDDQLEVAERLTEDRLHRIL